MNNKAFTLVEVIAVVAILGFLTLLTVPAISRIITSNDQKAVNVFKKTLKNSAKAYVNTKNIEISTSRTISCNDLKNEDFIKECEIRGYNCTDTYVVVTRDTSESNKKYKYEAYATCTRK